MEEIAHSNLTGIAIVALAALVCGMAMERVRQPAFVGYILAGLLLGPTAFGVVQDRVQIDALADLGVLMLLFVIAMELPLRLFLKLWRFVLLTTFFQVASATIVMLIVSMVLGWSLGMAVVLGFVVALSSTAVALKILENTGELKSRSGLIAVGVLIAQDLAFVPMILVLGLIAVGETDYQGLLALAGSIIVLAGLLWYLAKGGRITLPLMAKITADKDLTPVTGLALCFGAAALSGLLGLAPAYGAFLAGLVLGNSSGRRAMIGGVRPIQSILMMVFFLSIGLLIDFSFIWENIGQVLFLLFVVTIFKTAMTTAILKFLGQSWPHAFLASVMLAQIGEFSFLLSRAGLETGLIDDDVMRLVVAVTVLSLAISPVWVVTARRLHDLTRVSISTFGELMKIVYGREADLLAKTVTKARPQAALAARRIGDAIRKSKGVVGSVTTKKPGKRQEEKSKSAAREDGDA